MGRWARIVVLTVLGGAVARADATQDWQVLGSDAPDKERAAALGRLLAQPSARPKLVEQVQRSDGASIARLCEAFPSRATAELLIDALTAKSPAPRTTALKALATHWGAKDVVVPALVGHKATDRAERTQQLRACVCLSDSVTRRWLVQRAMGPDLDLLVSVFDPAFRRDVLSDLVVQLPASQMALKRLSGQDFGLSAAVWRRWIAALPQVSRPGAGGVPNGGSVTPSPSGPTFFGITVARSDVVLLLDGSASMERGNRLDTVKRAAKRIVESRRPTDRFNVVFFATKAVAFRKEVVNADALVREEAQAFIGRRKAKGGTNLGAGLRAALSDPRVKEIVLYSDGFPTRGKVRSARDALALFKDRRVRVHMVASGHGAARLFDLAHKTGGRTVVVP